jgi:hypothetical protein
MPEWAQAILDGLTGEFGVIVLLCIVVYFLWRLFREKERDVKSADARVDNLTEAVKDLMIEFRAGLRRSK